MVFARAHHVAMRCGASPAAAAMACGCRPAPPAALQLAKQVRLHVCQSTVDIGTSLWLKVRQRGAV